MAELIRLKLKDLYRGDRLRPVDMGIAAAIGASFEERGQISPITVRRTPAKNKGGTPFTLIAGGNRCAAAEIIGWDELDALVVQADGAEAQMIEIAENLYRNELNALDRAIFVLKYRELWEEAHGKVERGGDRRSNPHDADLIFAPGREVARSVKDKLGFSEDKYERAVRIGKNLHPVLRAAVRGTEAETDQSKLLKLARLPADDQLRVAAALKEKPDLKLALSWLKPEKAAVDPQAALLTKLIAAWENASEQTRQEFLVHIGVDQDAGLGNLMASIKHEAEAA
ncbi:ParB N-terminal domain-containing protein [Shinella sp.]|uniref:ParB N-terminal domain-containing protein n=1 Tax=Shinella sp. TaxID=1870904 RepID=UPI002585CB1D|nr:ParB N-terminal domain-containing protein [Shinella sp.]MCW5711313.1 ParB N-terminal domain-containing protein [Shinella sp.]